MSEGTQKTALITGASRGLGRALALKLAAQGYHILALARTVGALESLDDEIQEIGGSATLIPVDLSDLDKISTLGPQLAKRYPAIHLFIANAGMLGDLSPVAQTRPDHWDAVMRVNATANHRLIGTLDPLLRVGKGTCIFVTSGAVQGCKAYWGAYAASKAALETMARCYAAEVEGLGVTVQVFDPGRFRSSMRAQAYPGENPDTLIAPEEVADQLVASLPQTQKAA